MRQRNPKGKLLKLEIRRHNGQSPYGSWLNMNQVPIHVVDSIENEIWESDIDSGHIIVGGQHYDWRKKSRKSLRKNPLRRTEIYGQVLRVDAQKTQNHICDAACKRYGHRYTHSFKVKSGARMMGLPNGDLLITSKKK